MLMNRLNFLASIIFPLVLGITWSQEKPNIVIFFTDDQGTLDTKAYGSDDLFTPNMDKLAQTGVRFSRAYAHTVCCPSRALLMTGRDNVRSAVNNWTAATPTSTNMASMRQNELTIAQMLKQNGYTTGAFGKWHLSALPGHQPQDFGFDEFFGLLGGFIDNYNHYFLHGAGHHDLFLNKERVDSNGIYFPSMMNREALKFIDRNNDKPFFLYMAYNIPHYPEQVEAEFDTLYSNLSMPRQSYAKTVTATDAKMGEIMDRIEQHGLRSNTFFLFMSDNGHSVENYSIGPANHNSGLPQGSNYGANGGGGNTGKWIGRKGNLYEGGIRVPLIISFPKKLPTLAVRDHMVGAEDILPTVLELCNIPRPTDRIIDGRSLWPILESNTAVPIHDVIHRQWQGHWAVIEENWKLYDNKLFDLTGNNPEQTEVTGANPGVVTRMTMLRSQINSSITNQDIGTQVQGIGCLDTNYTEYDSTATIRDQALCKTPIIIPILDDHKTNKSITISVIQNGIYFNKSLPNDIRIEMRNIIGEEISLIKLKSNQYLFSNQIIAGVYFIYIIKPNRIIKQKLFISKLK